MELPHLGGLTANFRYRAAAQDDYPRNDRQTEYHSKRQRLWGKIECNVQLSDYFKSIKLAAAAPDILPPSVLAIVFP